MLSQDDESRSADDATVRRAAPPLASLFSDEPAHPSQVVPVLADILRLLDSFHREGIRHDLLSPASIRLLEGAKPSIRTHGGEISVADTVAVADPKYALPESFWEGPGKPACAVSDSYVLGFMFYELFLGRRRFHAQFEGVENNNAVAWLGWHADRSRRLTPLAELIPNFPRLLSKLIEKMTEKDPAKRAVDLPAVLQNLESAGDTTVGAARILASSQKAGITHRGDAPSLAVLVDKGLLFIGKLKQRLFASQPLHPTGSANAEPDQGNADRHRLGAGLGKWLVISGCAATLLAVALLMFRHPAKPVPSAPRLFQVKFQANIPEAQFFVDGRPIQSASASLQLGPHQAQASASGYEPISKTFTVTRSDSHLVVFEFEARLASLRVSESPPGAKLILDGEAPADLASGAFTRERIGSGVHSLRIVTEDADIASLLFVTAPQKMPEITSHFEMDNFSLLITSAFGDSAKLYATPDWKVSLIDGSSRSISPEGLKLAVRSRAKSGTELVSEDGETRKLRFTKSRTPVLDVSIRKLPPRIRLVLTSNAPNPAIFINGRVSDLRMVRGRGDLALFPGTYRIKLKHRGYYESPLKEVKLDASDTNPVHLRFELKPANPTN
jgi:hypothetical protein